MNLLIDKFIDKEPLYYKISDDKIINITGEGGSGKTTYSNKYRNNPDYIVVDYDLIIEEDCPVDTIEYTLKQMLLEKYGCDFFKTNNLLEIKKVFTKMYLTIINYLLPMGKTIVLDGTQLRFMENIEEIRGELLILRPSLETCVERSIKRKKAQNPNISLEDLKKYEKHRRTILNELNPMLNQIIIDIDKMVNDNLFIENEQQINSK